MYTILLTAIGVGGATMIGAIIGFIFDNVSHKFSDIVLGFSAGIMLSAAVVGLIIPSLDYGNIFITILGIVCGAIALTLIDLFTPHIHNPKGIEVEKQLVDKKRLNKVLLFVLAIAIHNLPEGISVGVGFGTGDKSGALSIALGIALQNIPEGMVVIAPMVAVGVSKKKALLIALLTGFIEVLGTVIGYFAVSISTAILPFILAFAGGTMLYIITDEMIPETHSHGNERASSYAIIIGFCVMLILDFFIG